MSGSLIEVEITENMIITDSEMIIDVMNPLRVSGLGLYMDDFGTGYRSFSYLQQLHFDYIKIDGAFVQDILNNRVDQKMIKLIAEIGREAGMKTIAEYVQNAESLALLSELGVDMAQGYFVGRPVKLPKRKSTPISLSARRAKRSSH